MKLARSVAAWLGPNNWMVRAIRPVRERWLTFAYGQQGYPLSVNGVPLRCDPAVRWYFAPEYDPPVARFFESKVKPGMVCMSVGANLGIYPLQFAHWSAPSGKVFAFEPDPKTAGPLRRHVLMNNQEARIRVVERALSNELGQAEFHVAGLDGMSRLGTPNPSLAGKTTVISVAVDTIDHFCHAEAIRPDALMIDVEGFELAVLQGAKDLLRVNPPQAIVVEMHPDAWEAAGTNRAEIEKFLFELKLKAVPLSGQSDPFVQYGHVAIEPIER